MLRRPSASSSSPVASMGSLGSPMVRANTLVDPPGSGARAHDRAGQAVGGLVERAVAAEHDHDLGAGRRRALRQAGGVAAAARLRQRHLVVGGQRLLDHDPAACRHRRRRRVDEQQHLHGRRRTYPSATAARPAGLEASARCRATMPAMHVVVCVKQIPDPAEPGKLEGDNTLDRSGKLILDESDSYGVEMALQLVDKAGGGEVTLVSMAPNNETGGLRTALAMGAAKAILISRRGPLGRRRPRHRQGAGRRHQAGRARPGARRHGVERRLHGHRPGADRRPARPPVDHLRQGDPPRGRDREGPAPDRGRLRRGHLPAAGRRVGHRWRGRAPLPLLQGDHGRQVEAGRGADGRRPRPRRRPGGRRRRRPGDRRRRRCPRPRGRRDHRGRRAKAFLDAKIVGRSSIGLKVISSTRHRSAIRGERTWL